MGDRANCIMQYDGKKSKRVWFYTHWRGNALPGIVMAALARELRWDDESYLARIIFCEMIKGAEGEETGFGISLRQADNEYPYLVVDIEKQRVFFEAPPGDDLWEKYHKLKPQAGKGWTFEEYIKNGPKTMADVQVNR